MRGESESDDLRCLDLISRNRYHLDEAMLDRSVVAETNITLGRLADLIHQQGLDTTTPAGTVMSRCSA